MCGIAGIWNNKGDPTQLTLRLKKIINRLSHRGPDGSRIWIDPTSKGGLAFSRLAIIDLSENGMQPFWNQDKTIGLVFNGEFYGYKKWRQQLVSMGYKFKSMSDAEVVLYLYEEYGLEKFLEYLKGMYGLAIWDNRKNNKLILVRDRMGEKPLYVCENNGEVVFASEMKAIREDPCFESEFNEECLVPYLMLNHIPAPQTAFKNVTKLRPAECIIYSAEGKKQFCYWKLDFRKKSTLSIKEQEEVFIEKAKESIKEKTISDVPVSVFLSGGIDSTVIAKEIGKENIQFAICARFDEKYYDESKYAKMVANQYDIPYLEKHIGNTSMIDLSRFFHIIDEPFADEAIIPLSQISAVAKQNCRVVLSGDGGDELVAGYNTSLGSARQRIIGSLFWKLRYNLLSGLHQTGWIKKKSIESQIRMRHAILPETKYLTRGECFLPEQLGRYCYKGSDMRKKAYNWLGRNIEFHKDRVSTFEDFILSHHFEIMSHCFLTKTDLATMSFSIESRAPFLDHELVEMMAMAPASLKVDKGVNKIPLRKLLASDFSVDFINRKKHGFSTPIDIWLRTKFRVFAQELLIEKAQLIGDYIERQHIKTLWNQHMSGQINHGKKLWLLLVLEGWFRKYISRDLESSLDKVS